MVEQYSGIIFLIVSLIVFLIFTLVLKKFFPFLEKQKEHQGFGRHEKIQRWTSFDILIKSRALLGNLLAIYI